jgi:hypothetical protein
MQALNRAVRARLLFGVDSRALLGIRGNTAGWVHAHLGNDEFLEFCVEI